MAGSVTSRTRFARLVDEQGEALPLRVRWCSSFACRLRGLTFRRHLNDDEGLLFVESTESRLGTAIHMAFVFFSIGVVWLDGDGVVVDKVLARPFRPFYAPRAPARYFLEGPPALLTWVEMGTRYRIVEPGDEADAAD
jgi:uncharacterized membrane protein (UPF0127 family)